MKICKKTVTFIISAVMVFNCLIACADSTDKQKTQLGSSAVNYAEFECENVSGDAQSSLYYGEVDAYKSIIWDITDFRDKGNVARLKYKLPKKLELVNGPVTIDISFKILDGEFALKGFPNLPNSTVFGVYQWSNTDIYRLSANNNAFIANDWSKVVSGFKENFKIKADNLKESFYTFRYVIYPSAGNNGFRFYYKKDIDGHWYEPYGEYKMGDNYNIGVLPAGKLPKEFDHLDFNVSLLQGATQGNNVKIAFKDISVNQALECASSNVSNGGILSKSYFEITFNSPIELSTITSDTLNITKDGKLLTMNTDFEVTKKDDFSIVVHFISPPTVGSRYSIVFNGINRLDYFAKLDEELSFTFTAGTEKQLITMYSQGIFVSTYGSANGDGSMANPLLNVESAIAKWKELNTQIGIKPTIYLRAGEYRINDTIYLDESCSDIIISGYGGENVILNGASEITSDKIRAATANDCDGRLNKKELSNIVRIDISHLDNVFRADDNKDVSNCEIINNDNYQKLAAWPNDGNRAYTGSTSKNDDGTFSFISSKKDMWSNLANDVMIEGYWYADYQFERGKVVSKNDDTGEICVSQNRPSFSSNRRYRFYNLPEEIDCVGEYYINYAEKAAYLMIEPNEQNNLEITGTPDGIFSIISGADNITIKDITIKNTRGTAVKIYDSDNVSITGCYIYNTGGNGIAVTKSLSCSISNSYFANNGYISVRLECGDIASLTNSNCSVKNCEFEYGGRLVKTYSPFIYTSGVGFDISNNRFSNHPHSAILFYGCENIIKNNVFENIVTETDDSGAIYSRVDPTYRGNVITNNIFKNIKSFKSEIEYADVFGVYIDDLLQDVTVSENLFYNCMCPFNFGGGRSNRFKDNAIYNSPEGGGYLVRSNALKDSLKSNNGYMWSFVNALRKSELYDEDKWFSKYPNYKKFVNDLDKQNADSANTDASVIKDGEITGNVLVSPNADKSNYIKISSSVTQNGNVSNNYKSSTMNDIETDGTYIKYSNDVKQLGYSQPDISNAGLLNAKKNKPSFDESTECEMELSDNGFDIDFTKYRQGEAAENCYDGLISYTPFATATLSVDVEDGQHCLKLTHPKADFAYNNYFSCFFKPISTSQGTIEFESGIKLKSVTAGNVGFMTIQGYDEQNPNLPITIAEGVYNGASKTLKYANTDITLDDNEILNEFVQIKVRLDMQNSNITVYKAVDGVYEEVIQKSVSNIPEYINRVKYYSSNVENTDAFICWFNNIKVYTDICAAAYKNVFGGEILNLSEYPQNEFCIKFKPRTGYENISNIIAVYNSDDELLRVELGSKETFNLNKTTFGNDCYYKCIQLESLESCRPLSKCSIIK